MWEKPLHPAMKAEPVLPAGWEQYEDDEGTVRALWQCVCVCVCVCVYVCVCSPAVLRQLEGWHIGVGDANSPRIGLTLPPPCMQCILSPQ